MQSDNSDATRRHFRCDEQGDERGQGGERLLAEESMEVHPGKLGNDAVLERPRGTILAGFGKAPVEVPSDPDRPPAGGTGPELATHTGDYPWIVGTAARRRTVVEAILQGHPQPRPLGQIGFDPDLRHHQEVVGQKLDRQPPSGDPADPPIELLARSQGRVPVTPGRSLLDDEARSRIQDQGQALQVEKGVLDADRETAVDIDDGTVDRIRLAEQAGAVPFPRPVYRRVPRGLSLLRIPSDSA